MPGVNPSTMPSASTICRHNLPACSSPTSRSPGDRFGRIFVLSRKRAGHVTRLHVSADNAEAARQAERRVLTEIDRLADIQRLRSLKRVFPLAGRAADARADLG